LSDDELRALWKAAEASGTFGAFVKVALLTAQRRAKVAGMRWADIDEQGVWTIPTVAREKGNAVAIKLPTMAREIIEAIPHLGENPHIFAGRGNACINGFSKSKLDFDKKLPAGTPAWQIHDLRRTARSLLARAGVRPDIAERVLGHAIPGVEGIYDRHRYDVEKADALAKLAALIDAIVHPQPNVIPLTRKETV
jgi:integrase